MKPRGLPTTRSHRGAAAFLAIVVATLAVLVVPAGGEAPGAVGWWTSLNQGDTVGPVPTLVPGVVAGNTTPPDVPAGGFEVANTPGDTSFAAIGYAPFDTTVKRVVLKIAPNTATLPNSTVQACPLSGGGDFAPASGGPLSQGPKYDCATAVPGVVDTTAGTVIFEAASLVQNGYLAIAIVATGTSRIVFSAPDQTTVETVVAAPAAPPVVPEPTASAEAPVTTAPPVFQSTAPALTTSAPEPAPVVAPPAAVAAPATTPKVAAAPVLLAVTQHGSKAGAGSAAVGALIVLIAALSVARRNRRALATVSGSDGHGEV